MQRIRRALQERSPLSQLVSPIEIQESAALESGPAASISDSLAAQADLNELVVTVLQNLFAQLTRVEREIEFLESENLRLHELHQSVSVAEARPESNGKHPENHP